MRKLVLTCLTAAALAGSAFAYNAFAAPGDTPDAPRMHEMADRGFLLDAKLAGMKAALKLTPDQDKLWSPFESAVRNAVKARREAMRERMDGDERPSPIERLNQMSDHLAKASSRLKLVADAAKPLYDGLDETQQRHFGPLLKTLRPQHSRHRDGGDGQ